MHARISYSWEVLFVFCERNHWIENGILITDFLNFEAGPMGPMLFCIVWEIAVLCC